MRKFCPLWKFSKNLVVMKCKFLIDKNNTRNLIIDGLQERNISQGDIIVRQGDHGEEFFIIEEGKAVVLKTHGIFFGYKNLRW